MRYPVVIHKDPDSDYGVTVPDLPGCFSAGATMDEALLNVVEAIECHLEGMLIDGEAAPAPKMVEQHRDKPDYVGGVWALVPVDLSKLSGKARRINITLPERVLNVLDKYAGEAGESRSGLIAQAALEYVAARAQATYPMVIEEVARNSIRRNDEVVGQSTESLYTIQGIGATFERKLKEAGIESTEALLKVGAPPKGREEIAVKAGIGDKLILEWVNHVELYRIRGVASEYSDLLEAAGVDTVVELAQRVPANLFAKMAEVNQVKKLVRKMPTKKQVSDWIAQAKILPRIVED